MNKWMVLGIKFGGIIVACAVTGIGLLVCCGTRADFVQFSSGWLGGAITAGAAAAALVWKPDITK